MFYVSHANHICRGGRQSSRNRVVIGEKKKKKKKKVSLAVRYKTQNSGKSNNKPHCRGVRYYQSRHTIAITQSLSLAHCAGETRGCKKVDQRPKIQTTSCYRNSKYIVFFFCFR